MELDFDDSELSSREQICSCIGILQRTLLDLDKNFHVPDGGKSLLKEKMDSVSSGSWRPGEGTKKNLTDAEQTLGSCQLFQEVTRSICHDRVDSSVSLFLRK